MIMAIISHALTSGLVILVGLAISCCKGRVCDADRNTNGCSTPMGINAPYKREFTPACDKHDICYGCVSTYFFMFCFDYKFVECSDFESRPSFESCCRDLNTGHSL